jgi:hypothetical protein
MAIIVERTDTFEEWRLKTNLISLTADATSNIGNLQQLVTATKSNIVAAINETETSANITGGRATFTGNVGIGGIPSISKFLISDSEKGMTIYGAGGATVPYALYASGGVNAFLGQVVGANSAIRGYNSTTNSNGYLGRQYYGVHGVGPLQGVGPGESIGVVGTVTGSANIGVYGYNETTASYGYLSTSGSGVQGYGGSQNVGAGASIGVYGQASGTANVGVYGRNETTISYGYIGISGYGVQGYGGSQNVVAGGSVGVYGFASGTGNIGVFGRNGAGYGYLGYGTYGIYGGITGAGNIAIKGTNETTNSKGYLGSQYYGVQGVGPTDGVGAGEAYGVVGTVTGLGNVAVHGYNGTTLALAYLSLSGFGVKGYGGSQNVGAGASIGVYGQASGTANVGVIGKNETTNSFGYLGRQYYGVHGVGPTDGVGAGESIGVVGTVTGSANIGVYGFNETTASYGYIGISGSGVQGYGGSQNVGYGASVGMYGQARGTANVGVYGRNGAGYGYIGYGTYGIYGGITGAGNIAILAANETTGAYSYLGGPDNFGLYTVGNAYISGDVGVGTTNPTAKLDVVGRMRVGSDASGADTGTGTVIWNTAGGDAGFAGFQQIFYTGANSSRTERMRIDNNGNVGIGTSVTDSSKFSVRGGNVVFSSSGEAAVVRIDNTETSNAIYTTCLSLRFPDMANVTANVSSAFLVCTDSANIGGRIARLVIRPSGSIQNLTGTYGTLSDRRVKENIVDATSKLDDVMQLRVRNFNFTNDTLKQIGFVAQEMEEVFPGLVEISENDMKAVKTSILIPILVKALQELTIQVDDLKYELNLLKANIS